MSESELLIEIMGDMFGDITNVLSGMMSNLSKGGPDSSSSVSSGADPYDSFGTQTRLAILDRILVKNG
jgi:hypothetical protein